MSNQAQCYLKLGKRRRAPRHCSTREAVCHLMGCGRRECRWALVKDLSVRGAGLVVWRPVDPGTLVLIELQGERGSDPFGRLARVIRLAAQDDGSWLIGCTFASKLNEDQLGPLLG